MLAILLTVAIATAHAPAPHRAAISHWELDGDLTSSSGAAALEPTSLYRGGRPRSAFRTVDGRQVLKTTPGTALRLRHGLLPNGGGTLVNDYTLVADLRVQPRSRRGFIAVLQTHGLNVNQAELGLDPTRGVAVYDAFGGEVAWGRWYRLVLVVDASRGVATAYLDGVAAATRPVSVDGRYALEPEALLFADDDLELGYVELDRLQIRDVALDAAAVAALGAADERPIHPPPPPLLRVTSPAEGARLDVADVADVRWRVFAAPHGRVKLSLLRAGRPVRELAALPVARRGFAWHVDNDLPAGDDYALRLEWLGPGRNVADSQRFSIVGAAPGGARAPLELAVNGAFERGLEGWVAKVGEPALSRGDSGDDGRRFLVGGPGDYTLVQEIPLAPRGYDAADVRRGLSLDASVRLRAEEQAGRFDDQAWLEVAFLAADGARLGAARSLPAAGTAWRELRAPALVPAGTETLQVALHGRLRRGSYNDAAADDVRIALQDGVNAAPVTITKLPVLYGPATDSVVVLWETDVATATHSVRWREEGRDWRTAGVETQRVTEGHVVQRAILAPLRPGRRYRYEVRSDDAMAGPYAFESAPEADATHNITWLSDNQDGYPVFRGIVPQLAAASPRLAIFVGDLVQHGQFLREWQQQWFGPLSVGGFGQSTPMVFARGNHDGEHDLAYAYSALPGNEAWYAFTFGRVRYVFLDTEAHPVVAPSQTAWLERELASPVAQEADFRVVVLHKPPFTNFWDRPVYDGQVWVRKRWVPLFEQHGVDLVVAGHAHGYMRLRRGDITYLVVGGGGGLLDHATSGTWDATTVAKTHHYAVMEAAPGRLTFEVRDAEGAPLDSFTLESRTAAAGKTEARAD